LKIVSCFFPRLAWTLILLFYTSCHSWDDRCMPPHPTFFHRDGVSQTFLPRLSRNSTFPNLSFLRSWVWQVYTTISTYWLRWGILHLPGLNCYKFLCSSIQFQHKHSTRLIECV
jgi:hypothetical protein